MAKNDFTRLCIGNLCRLLNKSSTVGRIEERVVKKHRDAAGPNIGAHGRIDLLKYACWLRGQLPIHKWAESKKKKQKDSSADYETIKENARERNAETSKKGRDIGELPAVRDPDRKAKGGESLAFFCKAYLPLIFFLPWSKDHRKIIAKLERIIRGSGKLAQAMPRGSGKTMLCLAASLWAILYGYRRFVSIVASKAEKGEQLLDFLKTWIETREELAADFPEAIYAIRKLERIAGRLKGQLYNGEPTRIEWSADKIVFPTIPGNPSSGSIVMTCGLKGSDIRGQVHALSSGEAIRPDLVLLDDPQTRESAWSELQCRQREAIIAGDVLGMAGPGHNLAAMACVTIIRPDDLADRLVDRKKHPEWQGERMKMVYAFPKRVELWDQYAQILRDSLTGDGDGSAATEFYRRHFDEMNEGAEVAWQERFEQQEISGLQHAMNWKIRDEKQFLSECQNEPAQENLNLVNRLTAFEICMKLNGRKDRDIPAKCSHVTGMIDVHDRLLYYTVCHWEENFDGGLCIYGTWPEQPLAYFTLHNAPQGLADLYPGRGKDGLIFAGLEELIKRLLAERFKRDDGAEMQLERLLVDTGYVPTVVGNVIRLINNPVVMPSRGFSIKAEGKPFAEYKPEAGAVIGHHWRIAPAPAIKMRTLFIDVNYWKSFFADRLATPLGDAGCFSLFGSSPHRHQLLADHWCSQISERTFGRGRWVDVWMQRPEHFDDHLHDTAVGCAAAASSLGCRLPEWGDFRPRRRAQKISLNSMWKKS
jgi:hypothetical protein